MRYGKIHNLQHFNLKLKFYTIRVFGTWVMLCTVLYLDTLVLSYKLSDKYMDLYIIRHVFDMNPKRYLNFHFLNVCNDVGKRQI